MKLLTKKLRAKLPPLYSQENITDPMVSVKFFMPDGGWTWYATEGSPVDENGIMIEEGSNKPEHDFLFFGFVRGVEGELGYFSLAELQKVCGLFGLPVERDLYFTPCKLSQIEQNALV